MKRLNLITASENIQRSLCGYDHFGIVEDAYKPRFCDCKPGASGPVNKCRNKVTYCPEMKQIHLLLSSMTDEEFDTIMNRY